MADPAAIGVALLAYLLGSVPTAYLVGRWLRGIDIRGVGSGNPGAANATMQLGKGAGALVLAVDAGKGALAVLVGQRLGVSDVGLYIAAFLATVGHNFTPFLRFRGGKGAATVLGISLLMLWQLTLVSGAIGLALGLAARHIVAGMAGVFIALNALTIATAQPLGQIALCLALSALVAGTHLWRQRAALGTAVANRDWRGFMGEH